jgi:hypothetical protein
MPEIQQLRVVVRGVLPDWMIAPHDLPAVGRAQARELSKQAGFAAAVVTADMQPLTGLQLKADAMKQVVPTALA